MLKENNQKKNEKPNTRGMNLNSKKKILEKLCTHFECLKTHTKIPKQLAKAFHLAFCGCDSVFGCCHFLSLFSIGLMA